MRILVNCLKSTLAECGPSSALGHLLSPRAGDTLPTLQRYGLHWAADNDAFSGFDPIRYARFVDRVRAYPNCQWMAVPDVVADAEGTLQSFSYWAPKLIKRGLPIAIVLQDGMTPSQIPWRSIDAVFIGGSTDFKMSGAAFRLVEAAHKRNLLVHMGRVNSLRRLHYAWAIGCHTVDGTGYSWFKSVHRPDNPLVKAVRYLEKLQSREGLRCDSCAAQWGDRLLCPAENGHERRGHDISGVPLWRAPQSDGGAIRPPAMQQTFNTEA